MSALALSKWHGLGNDFLVALDPAAFDEAANGSPELLVRRLCDRHRGLGADGLIVARAPRHGGDVAMDLRNADGSSAETSGNGLRCLALAVLEAGPGGDGLAVETAAGSRRVERRSPPADGTAVLAAEMGRLAVAEVAPLASAELPGSLDQPWPAFAVDAGNPHLVVVAPSLGDLDIALVGPRLERDRPGGQNLEVVSLGPDPGAVDLVVWERGAGVTLACGSGSTAAAAALHAAGLTGASLTVHNPGGSVGVELAGDDRWHPLATLIGPADKVADVAFDDAALARLLAPATPATAPVAVAAP